MTLKLSSYETVKELYLKKHEAQLKNDVETLEKLRKDYPELFDTRFLLDLVKEGLIRMGLVNKDNLN